ncbi:MAG TPA: FtsX-like permease family protein [Methanospirillum sp.]|uniref:ABC transporter permease n=1 Tax=Methanospirillum sp. TaxID=45200 RepID=UPI002CB409D8|nr:FtsX-like permease family protein [Methanospirillum sp.]HWQ64583.1 FtsX-like permease family protein [Methanospirillum sp.]
MSLQHLKVSFFLAIRGLSRGSRGSLYLSILIIAMVFTNMIFMSSIIMGVIKNSERSIIEYQTGNILVETKDNEQYIEDVSSLLDKLNRIPGVIRASAHYSMGATLKNEGNRIGGTVTAVRPDDERMVTGTWKKMKEGEYLSDGETGEVIIGIQTAGHKDKNEDMGSSLGYVRTGDPVTIEYTNGVTREYRVKGIFETRSYQADMDVFVTWNEMESVLGHPIDTSTGLIIKTAPDLPEAQVKQTILRFGVQEKVKTWQDLLEEAFGRAIQSFSIINSVTVIVSLVIAIVVLFIVIMIKTLNSRRQIGVLKAIGVEKSIIINNYLFQVLLLTTAGTILGVCIVEGMVGLLTLYPIKFPDGDVTPYASASDLITNTILLYIAAAIAGYIPAWRVASEDIMTAMRA